MKAVTFLLIVCLLAGCVDVPEGAIKADVETVVASPQFKAKLAENVKAEVQTQFDTRVSGELDMTIKREVEKTVATTVGDQTAGEKGVNIGAVTIDGGSAVLAALLFLVALGLALWLYRRKARKATQTVDFLVGQLEPAAETMKNNIQIQATAAKVERFLNKRVRKVTNDKTKTKR